MIGNNPGASKPAVRMKPISDVPIQQKLVQNSTDNPMAESFFPGSNHLEMTYLYVSIPESSPGPGIE